MEFGDLRFDHGRAFPPAMSFAGQIVMFGSAVIFAIEISAIPLAPFLIGLFLWRARRMTEIDQSKQRVREFIQFGPVKSGDWIDMRNFTNISVVRKTLTTHAYSWANTSSETSRQTVFMVVLLSSDHLFKFDLAPYLTEDLAIKAAHDLGDRLGLRYVKFGQTTTH
jgi:hypothetical protein